MHASEHALGLALLLPTECDWSCLRSSGLRSEKLVCFLSPWTDPLDINPSVDFLFDCGLVGPEDVPTEQDLPRTMRKVRAGAAVSTEERWGFKGPGGVGAAFTARSAALV